MQFGTDFSCSFCGHQFDEEQRAPRLLDKCKHYFCSSCIGKQLEINKTHIICMTCSTKTEGTSLVSFPLNQDLLFELSKQQQGFPENTDSTLEDGTTLQVKEEVYPNGDRYKG